MQKDVFILGAGASCESGVPLLNEFITRGLQVAERPEIGGEKSHFDRVDAALTALNTSLYIKSNIGLKSIEDVFGLIEMGVLINKFPGCSSPEEIERLRKSIIRFIVVTIEQTNRYTHERGTATSSQGDYDKFVEVLVGPLLKQGRSVSIITFNYDVALDFSLNRKNLEYDYSLSDTNKPSAIRLLKLHGSINWGSCPKCHSIVPISWREYDESHNVTIVDDLVPETLPIRIGSTLNTRRHLGHCQEQLSDEPVLVPPTWNKTEHHRQLSAVWKHASIELGEAENIYIIGYSVPESDMFFRYIYALGTINPGTRLKRLWIINPMSIVRDRLEGIIGKGIEDVRYIPNRFQDAIDEIARGYNFPKRPAIGFDSGRS
jgi:hypothetical protein